MRVQLKKQRAMLQVLLLAKLKMKVCTLNCSGRMQIPQLPSPLHPDSQVMLCGGLVARAHTKWLGELAKQNSFSTTLQDIYKEKFSEVLIVKCYCPK